MRYVVNILYTGHWSHDLHQYVHTWYHHRDIEVSVHHSTHRIIGHWQCTIVNRQARIHVLVSLPYIQYLILMLWVFYCWERWERKSGDTKLSKYWLAIDKNKQTTLITLTVLHFLLLPLRTSVVAASFQLSERCLLQTPPFPREYEVHPWWLHRFFVTLAPCVIQTPPFTNWWVHPLWLHRFLVAP